MGKFTYKDIKAIKECTPDGLKDRAVSDFKNIKIGYYQRANTNWSYNVYVVLYDGILYQVAVSFGYIL